MKYADGDLGTVAASNLIHIVSTLCVRGGGGVYVCVCDHTCPSTQDSLKVGVAVSAVPLFLEPSQSSSDLQPSVKINGTVYSMHYSSLVISIISTLTCMYMYILITEILCFRII